LAIDPASQIRQILAACSVQQREEIIKLLRTEYRIHRIEREWNTSAEIVLEAIARSGPLTQRMFKGILAEAAFKVEVLDRLEGWRDVTPPGTHAYDFAVGDADRTVTIQTKLQRKQAGKPFMYRIPGKRGPATAFYVVETQKSRKGVNRTSGESTRPYRVGEFDILAVSVEPATGDWSQFRFTVGSWLIRRPGAPNLIAIFQPVSLEPNEDWTDSLSTAMGWLYSGRTKTISVERAAEGSGG
jgi:hypothetical protein